MSMPNDDANANDNQHAYYPLKYFGFMNGIGTSTALLIRPLTCTCTSVPFLCHPEFTYPIAMFCPSDGDGIPDVTAPTFIKIIVRLRLRKM
jgi:hypothetical protein